MTPFRDLPIRRKLLLTTLASTGAALLLASGGFLMWDMYQFRQLIQSDVEAQAVIVAENSGAPLEFQDDRVGSEILRLLHVRPQIQAACTYSRDGAPFASYLKGADACPSTVPGRTTFGWRALEFVSPIHANGRPVGTLYIRRDLADLYARFWVGGGILLGLLLLAIGAAHLTGTRMQRFIAEPLLDLAETARAISTSRNYSLRAVPRSNDEIGVVVHSFNEMLDRIAEALEREREVNRLKDEFLATLSHELRTPLTAVLGWTRMLRTGRLDAAMGAQALETIERNARSQAMLIDDLLDMSGIVSGKPRLHVHEADLAAIVDAAIDVIRPAATAKRLQLDVRMERPAVTHADSGRLQQVVWNLLSNAVKFTPTGGHVWIRLARANGYRLAIRDSGPGIDPTFLPYVFEPFRQADGSTTREHGGLGLGLAIAKQLVELHGGTVTAHSAGRGHGATFEVHLPSVVAPTPADLPLEHPAAALPSTPLDNTLLRGLHVLVVDDEADARTLLETALREYGARVTTASGVADALGKLEQELPDVVLSDIGMPNEHGYTLIQELRRRPRTKGGAIPAVAVTAYASVKDGLAAEAAGFQAHIAKPFEPADVASLVALLGHPTESGR